MKADGNAIFQNQQAISLYNSLSRVSGLLECGQDPKGNIFFRWDDGSEDIYAYEEFLEMSKPQVIPLAEDIKELGMHKWVSVIIEGNEYSVKAHPEGVNFHNHTKDAMIQIHQKALGGKMYTPDQYPAYLAHLLTLSYRNTPNLPTILEMTRKASQKQSEKDARLTKWMQDGSPDSAGVCPITGEPIYL